MWMSALLDLSIPLSNLTHLLSSLISPQVYVPYSTASSSSVAPSSLNRDGVAMVRVSALEVRSIQDKKVYMMYLLLCTPLCLLILIPPAHLLFLSAFDIASPDRNRSLEIDFENVLKKFSNSVMSLPVPSPIPPPARTAPVAAIVPLTIAATAAPSEAQPILSKDKAQTVALVEALWTLLPTPLLDLLQTYFPVDSFREKSLILLLLSLVGRPPLLLSLPPSHSYLTSSPQHCLLFS
jgi:hypothetical protein